MSWRFDYLTRSISLLSSFVRLTMHNLDSLHLCVCVYVFNKNSFKGSSIQSFDTCKKFNELWHNCEFLNLVEMKMIFFLMKRREMCNSQCLICVNTMNYLLTMNFFNLNKWVGRFFMSSKLKKTFFARFCSHNLWKNLPDFLQFLLKSSFYKNFQIFFYN